MRHKFEGCVTVEDAALILNRSVATTYRLVRANGLRRERVLGRVLFRREDIERLAAGVARK